MDRFAAPRSKMVRFLQDLSLEFLPVSPTPWEHDLKIVLPFAQALPPPPTHRLFPSRTNSTKSLLAHVSRPVYTHYPTPPPTLPQKCPHLLSSQFKWLSFRSFLRSSTSNIQAQINPSSPHVSLSHITHPNSYLLSVTRHC